MSQLDAAISFLETHYVALITLDLGANDVDQCISVNGVNTACVEKGLASVGSNLPWILSRLRAAAGPRTPIVAMNYYDPFLAAWVLAPANGPALALESLEVTTGFNALLEAVYASFAVPVADVAHAFRIYNFAPLPAEDVPLNVFLTGVYTWMGTAPPRGPNDCATQVVVDFANTVKAVRTGDGNAIAVGGTWRAADEMVPLVGSEDEERVGLIDARLFHIRDSWISVTALTSAAFAKGDHGKDNCIAVIGLDRAP